MTVSPLRIPADHPAYSGHFPGAPVLPGVVLLDAALHVLENELAAPRCWQITSAKFLSGVRPGETLMLEHESTPAGAIRFAIRTTDRLVASGVVTRSGAGQVVSGGVVTRPAANRPRDD